jgi:hypothetical protein
MENASATPAGTPSTRRSIALSDIRSLLRNPRVWVAIGAAVVVLAAVVWWGVRSHRRSEALDALNSFAPFVSPPLDIQFPEVVAATEKNMEVLQMGFRNGVWTLRKRNPSAMEVLLTNQGQRWFSAVERRIIATFKAGNREATEVISLSETFPTRQIRFRYRWRQFHPGSAAVLGKDLPSLGNEYEGEAVMFYENNRWQLKHWNTPDFDDAMARFKSLEPALQ